MNCSFVKDERNDMERGGIEPSASDCKADMHAMSHQVWCSISDSHMSHIYI
jgi:hypothetical protein